MTYLSLALRHVFDVGIIGQLKDLKEIHLDNFAPTRTLSLQQPFHDLSNLIAILLMCAFSFHSEFLLLTIQSIQFYNMNLPEGFIEGLCRIHNLRNLTLKNVAMALNTPGVGPQLHQLTKLTELNLKQVDFHNVVELFEIKVEVTETEVEINCQPFKRLTQLKELTINHVSYYSTGVTLKNILNSLGSVNTLEKLEIRGTNVGDEFLKVIGKFVNLMELNFKFEESLTSEQFNKFGQLKNIKKFHIHLDHNLLQCYHLNIPSETIVSLAERSPSLELFELKRGSDDVNDYHEVNSYFGYIDYDEDWTIDGHLMTRTLCKMTQIYRIN